MEERGGIKFKEVGEGREPSYDETAITIKETLKKTDRTLQGQKKEPREQY